MAKPRDDRQKDLLRPALEQVIDLGHPLVRLAQRIDWGFLDWCFSSVCAAGDGRPPLPTRLVAGLLILKHMHSLSDEALCAGWLENPYYQFFCGELSFCHRLPFDRSSLTGKGETHRCLTTVDRHIGSNSQHRLSDQVSAKEPLQKP